jgi:multicomponent Na+:H+ antiporter subunit E
MESLLHFTNNTYPRRGVAHIMNAESPDQRTPKTVSFYRSALARVTIYFVSWMILMPSLKLSDLAFGLLAAGSAAWMSIRLLPPQSGQLRSIMLLALLPHFLWESVLAGADVARRALDPKLPLNTGFVNCPINFPPGLTRNRFATITSLLPGSVAVDDTPDALIYHCLDISEPVVEQLYEKERLFSTALVVRRDHA